MIEYDSKVIHEFAERLYKKANSVIRNYAIIGVFVGAAAGLATQQPVAGIVGAIIGGVLGYLVGKDKAFLYKLQAQTALCQAKIEANTKA